MTGVLFLTESFHPVLGGGEQHIRALSRALVESGLRATVVTRQSEATWPRAENLDGVRVVRVPPPGPARRGKYRMVPAALRALWREAPAHDVVVVRGTRVLALPGLLSARLRGPAVVMQPELNGEMSGEAYTWGTRFHRPGPRRLVRALIALRNGLLRDADAFVAMSRTIEREFLEAGVPAEKIAYIPHGVDTQRFCPASTEEKARLRSGLGWPAEIPVAVYTGRLLRGKGLEVLVDAFARVGSRQPSARLVLVGSGAGQAISVEDELRAQVERHGLGGRVTFTGRLEDVGPVLRAADVFVFPSEFEALGLSLLEAAACGLACIGSRTGGIVDVIEDGRTGLLVPPGNRGALSAALDVLLADGAARAVLGAAARARACAQFDARDNVDRYRSLFAELSVRGRRREAWPRAASR